MRVRFLRGICTGRILFNNVSTTSTSEIVNTHTHTHAHAHAHTNANANAKRIPFSEPNFQILVSNILVRNPITLRTLSPFEKAYEQYRLELQSENARGVFDIMTPHKKELLQNYGAKEPLLVNEPDSSLPKEYLEADNQLSSMMRKLERKIYFVILDEEGRWRFPSKHVQFADVALHKHARENISKLLGSECEIYSVGNAPVAFHQETIPNRTVSPFGIKTFFFRSQIIGGRLNFTPKPNAQKYAWLTKEELKESLFPDYYQSVMPTLSY